MVFAAALAFLVGAATAADNPIVRQNAREGTAAWAVANAPEGAVEAYTSETDVLPGETIHLHVSARERYRVAVYRVGWYGGAGGRLVGCSPANCADEEQGILRRAPEPDHVTGRVVADWPVTDTVRIPDDAVSGYYLARVVLTSGDPAGKAGTVPFVVRPPPAQRSRVLVQVPVNTWEAYNAWGGKSLYDFNSTDFHRANHISFDRPYGASAQGPFEAEIQLVRFLEREGVDVSYQTDLDTHLDPSSLLAHRLVMTAGHDEYWTKEMRDAFDNGRDAGTNLAFMGSNVGYWQVRYEDGGRTIVGYKSTDDPVADPALKTVQFRQLVPARPECQLAGVMYMRLREHQTGPIDYTVTSAAAADTWLAGTGFNAGDVVKGVVNNEWDVVPNPSPPGCEKPTLKVLFHYEGEPENQNADAVRYLAPSGARVFSSGAYRFTWGLDTWGLSDFGWTEPADPRLQQFVRNMVDDLTRPAQPRAYLIRVAKRAVHVRFKPPNDPRVRGVSVLRQDRGRLVPVCTSKAGACVDRVKANGRTIRYVAATVDEWGASAHVRSNPVRLRAGRIVRSP